MPKHRAGHSGHRALLESLVAEVKCTYTDVAKILCGMLQAVLGVSTSSEVQADPLTKTDSDFYGKPYRSALKRRGST